LALFAFGSAQLHTRVADQQILQTHVQLAGFPHHAGFLHVRDSSDCLRTGLGDHHVADLQVFGQHQVDRIVFCGSL